jgi:hypothetical protein
LATAIFSRGTGVLAQPATVQARTHAAPQINND